MKKKFREKRWSAQTHFGRDSKEQFSITNYQCTIKNKKD